MITRRYSEPRGLHESTPFYGFYVKVSGESRRMLAEAQRRVTEEMGAIPSNPVLLEAMLKVFLSGVPRERHGVQYQSHRP